MSIETGKIEREAPAPATAAHLNLTRDGKSFAYVSRDDNTSNIRVRGFDGSAPRKLSSFTQGAGPTKNINSFAWSPDGKHIAVVRTTSRSDVILMRAQ